MSCKSEPFYREKQGKFLAFSYLKKAGERNVPNSGRKRQKHKIQINNDDKIRAT